MRISHPFPAQAHTRPAVAVDRGSSQHFDLTFTFDLEISTSTEPTIAGQPSDLILGGGANLRVLVAVEVQLDAETRSGLAEYEAGDELCILGNTTYEEKATAVSDAVFGGVAFAYAECHFKAQAMGGARVLGDGVYLVASGGGSGAVFQVIDTANSTNSKMVTYPGDSGSDTNLYDPYTRIVVD